MVNNLHSHVFLWVSLEIKMLGDGFLDPFGFYGRPMIIDPSTYIASLTHILFLANFAADQDVQTYF